MSDDKRSRRPAQTDRQALADMMSREPAPLRRPPQLMQRGMPELDDISAPHRRQSRPQPKSALGVRSSAGSLNYAPPPRPSPLAEVTADLHRAELLARAESRPVRASYRMPEPQPSALESLAGKPWVLFAVALVSIVIILYTSPPARKVLSSYNLPGSAPETVASEAAPAPLPSNPGEHSIMGAPSVTAAVIDRVLAEYGSPAAGSGQAWVALGEKYGIDPAYALAFFIHESSAGTNPAWAGFKPDGSTTHNIGNIICAGYSTCFGRFRDYGSWEEGIEDWYQLISVEYIGGRGAHTVEQIIPIYAPSFENNVPAYVGAVEGLVDEWRSGGAQ